MASNGNTATSSHLAPDESMDAAVQKIRTAGSITIPPELLEKMYLTPQQNVKGHLRQILGNPTALGIIGFVINLTPLSCDLMEWRGSGGDGAADIGVYMFFGGVLLLVAGFLEFILGNTFTFLAFMPFRSFYLAFGTTLQPVYGAYKAYGGLNSPAFSASIAYFFLFFGVPCFYYLICSLRTNLVFVWIFFTVTIGLGLVAALLVRCRRRHGYSSPMSNWARSGVYSLAAWAGGDLSHLIPAKSGRPKKEAVSTNQDEHESSKV